MVDRTYINNDNGKYLGLFMTSFREIIDESQCNYCFRAWISDLRIEECQCHTSDEPFKYTLMVVYYDKEQKIFTIKIYKFDCNYKTTKELYNYVLKEDITPVAILTLHEFNNKIRKKRIKIIIKDIKNL